LYGLHSAKRRQPYILRDNQARRRQAVVFHIALLLSEAASGTANSSYIPSFYQMKFINNAKPALKIPKSIAHAINRNWELSVTRADLGQSASSVIR
jgi:hypothetical protein